MTTKELSIYLQNEDKAEDYLLSKRILRTFTECPSCRSTHIGRIRRQRMKCYECKYEWNIRKGSWIEGSHLELSSFIGCVKFFADDKTAIQCADELEISRITVGQIYNMLRGKIIAPVDLSISDDPNLKLFISIDKDGIVIDTTNSITGGSQLRFKRSKNKDGAYLYELSYKNLRTKKLLKALDKIDALDDFYRYCQEKLLVFRSRDEKQLLWKLQELVFRYNNRKMNSFDLLIASIAH